MRKHVAPEVFEYMDGETMFQTMNKELAIVVFEHAKKKSAEDLDKIKGEVVEDLDSKIKRLKKELRDND